jgi:hypothetical protein
MSFSRPIEGRRRWQNRRQIGENGQVRSRFSGAPKAPRAVDLVTAEDEFGDWEKANATFFADAAFPAKFMLAIDAGKRLALRTKIIVQRCNLAILQSVGLSLESPCPSDRRSK